jgi:sugar/nucleoside kinase (ribokinase family)
VPPSGVLCCGNIVVDILVRPVDRFEFNTSVWVDSLAQQLGGNGASTAYTAGLLGVPARLLAYAGRDPMGDFALARLASAGCDLSFVVLSDEPTAASVVCVNSAGDRLILHRVGVGHAAFAEPIEFTPSLISGCSRFHLANLFAIPGLRRHGAEALHRARAAGLATSADTGWDSLGRWLEDLRACLPLTDLLFVNADEARWLTGVAEPAAAARRLHELGAGVCVVKLGAGGCLVSTGESEFVAPAFQVSVVDTTGAGDCFAGGFLAALNLGASLEEAARFANAVAALSVQQLGATEGLRSYTETRAWMERHSG